MNSKSSFGRQEGDPDSVRALYTFKEKLELSEDKQAKEVLVDVYDLLDFKKDAYELLCQIGNRSDKKTLKRLGTLKDYAENWAIIMPSQAQNAGGKAERKAAGAGPPFRYHPKSLGNWGFEESADGVVCDCQARRPIFSIQPLLRRGGYCISVPRSASPTAKQPGNMTVVFKMISLWMMV